MTSQDPTPPVGQEWRTLNAGELANRLDLKLRRRRLSESFARHRHEPVTARAIDVILNPSTPAAPPALALEELADDAFRRWLDEALTTDAKA